MELELKHVVGYFPYKLKMRHDYEKAKHKGETKLRLWEMELNFISASVLINKQDRKPILRPLSDLTKQIEVNGEKFVPREKLFSGRYSVLHNIQKVTTREMQITELWVIEKLYEWHFDVHGLIESGLAIDINTLK